MLEEGDLDGALGAGQVGEVAGVRPGFGGVDEAADDGVAVDVA